MPQRSANRRRIGIAACVVAIVLLGAALVAGKLIYQTPPSTELARLAPHDGEGR